MSHPPRILVVEDDPFLRQLITDQLCEAGYILLTAEDGAHALKVLEKQSVDVVISDIFMPNMEGIEMIRTLREQFPGLPIFATSGGTRLMDKDVILSVARRFGANETFTKPLDMPGILSKLKEYVGTADQGDTTVPATIHQKINTFWSSTVTGTASHTLKPVEAREISAVFDNVPDGLFLLVRAPNGIWRIRSSNRTATELFGIPSDEMSGMTLDDIFGVEAITRDGVPLPEICRETAVPVEEEKYLAARRDDYWVDFNWWHLKFVPIPDENGEIEEVAGICQIVTESRQMRESLKQFTSAISQASSIIAIVELDGTIDFINPAFEETVGISSEAAAGHSIFQFCMPPDARHLYAPMIDAMAKLEPWQGDLPSKNRTGSINWKNVRISPITNEKGYADRYLLIKEDITEKRQIESQLRLASRVLDTTDAGVIITNPQGIIESVNPGFTKITGYNTEEATGKPPGFLQSGVHSKQFYGEFWQQLAGAGHWSGEFINQRKDGEVIVCSMSISALYAPDGILTHYVGVFSDITKLKDSQQRLNNLANYDTLTGLPNRHHFLERLNRSFQRAKRSGNNVALMYLDLDHFKSVNDTLGHSAGDILLKEVSGRILQQLRDEDTLARLGGDEFVVILEGVADPECISVIAERIIVDIRRPFLIKKQDVHIGCSIGIAFFPKDAEDADTLLRNADLALYRAKDEGRNCYQIYASELNEKAHQRYLIETRLRKAVAQGELFMVYQPQFNTVDHRLIGAEALLRWNNPELGFISPAEFIPIAEQTGLIIPISLWIIEQVCRMQKQIIDQGIQPTRVAINISPVQFKKLDVVASFMKILEQEGVPPDLIEIEVTEGAIMVNPEIAIDTLNHLRSKGFTIAVDDFGTGYSSLGYLKRFPIDKLKIDQTFIRDLETDQDDAVIVSAIIAMSHLLGMKTLAEGVESDEQLEYLNAAGCDEIQGYLLGRPMPKADFINFCANQ
jgi:diguanylate cyclase (GGDEF)-like protein/PAS domain S-box-containing protein